MTLKHLTLRTIYFALIRSHIICILLQEWIAHWDNIRISWISLSTRVRDLFSTLKRRATVAGTAVEIIRLWNAATSQILFLTGKSLAMFSIVHIYLIHFYDNPKCYTDVFSSLSLIRQNSSQNNKSLIWGLFCWHL